MRKYLALLAGFSLSACSQTIESQVKLQNWPLPEQLSESSALSCDGDSLWSLNDSGNAAQLFQLSKTGQLLKLNQQKIWNQDWEAMEWVGDQLWVGDVGNNSGDRTELRLYGFNRELKQTQRVRLMVPEAKRSLMRHDVDFEALVQWQQQLWLVSKSWQSGIARFYQVNTQLSGKQPLPAASLEVKLPFIVTDASAIPGSDQLLLVGYANPRQHLWLAVQGKFEVWMAVLTKDGKVEKQQRLPMQSQVEGACVDNEGVLWLSSEQTFHAASLYRVTGWR